VNVTKKYQKALSILKCIECGSNKLIDSEENCLLKCRNCGTHYHVIRGIPRFVPYSYFNLDEGKNSIEEKTKNYFGFEWKEFEKWGFFNDEEISKEQKVEFFGGTISARKAAFDSKCRIDKEELVEGNIVLDAGCGNGRYTYEAAIRGKATVVGVDIGYGSVESAFKNNLKNDNVIIIQASLFKLPFNKNVFDASFSNGVLMHTGDAKKAFYEIAKTIKPNGTFVAHVYHKLNPIWEFNDYILRSITTRLSVKQNMFFAALMAKLGKLINKSKYLSLFANLFFRIQPTVIHMYDWYSAPIATHHTYSELAGWFKSCNFELLDNIPHVGLFKRPWAINLKGRKIG